MIHSLLIFPSYFTIGNASYSSDGLWMDPQQTKWVQQTPQMHKKIYDQYSNKDLDIKEIIWYVSSFSDSDTQWLIALIDSIIQPLLY